MIRERIRSFGSGVMQDSIIHQYEEGSKSTSYLSDNESASSSKAPQYKYDNNVSQVSQKGFYSCQGTQDATALVLIAQDLDSTHISTILLA